METKDIRNEGQRRYEEYWARQMADPEYRRLYKEEAAKKDLWLQRVEARQAADLTQAEVAKRLGVNQSQVSRIEKRGYDAYTLPTLRKYLGALGGSFRLEVKVIYLHTDIQESSRQPVTTP